MFNKNILKKFYGLFFIAAVMLTFANCGSYLSDGNNSDNVINDTTTVFYPLDLATNIDINTSITITFSNAVRLADNSEINNTNVADLITFKKTDDSGEDISFAADINSEKKLITIDPVDALEYEQVYYVAIRADIEDINNVAISETSITFMTIAEYEMLTDAEAVAADTASLSIGYASGDSASHVTQNISLATSGSCGTTITWASDDETVITADGTITRPPYGSSNVYVILTATITKGLESTTKEFELTVIEGNHIFLSEGTIENPIDLGNIPVNYNGQISSASASYYLVNTTMHNKYKIELINMSEGIDLYIYNDSNYTNQIAFSTQSDIDSETIEIISSEIMVIYIKVVSTGGYGTFFNLNVSEVSTYYEGDYLIQDSTDLQSLISYSHVNGDLIIKDTTDITSLEGLSGLIYISGSLIIENNTALESINGINNIEYLGESIIIKDNLLLNNLSSFSSITAVTGNILIQNNDSLVNLQGLHNISDITGSFTTEVFGLKIIENDMLIFLDMTQLLHIGGDLIIEENGSLCTNLAADLEDQVNNGDGIEGNVSISGNLHATFSETLYDDTLAAPSWIVSSDQLTYTQSNNSDPGIYTIPRGVLGETIIFEIRVNTTTDDDFIGWTVGYDPSENTAADSDWILFDWKRANGTDGNIGLAMSRVNGQITAVSDLGLHQESVSELARAATRGNTGWTGNTTYTVILSYTTKHIRVWVNGTLEIDAYGSFPVGNLGLYSYSQSNCTFTIVSPTQFNDCLE